jgi:FtsP/CotA-like multicopper oxidase with cupredoxin domain
MKTKFNNKVIFKALAILSTALVAFNVWANTGNSIYTNISGVNVNVPTFYANSPIGFHTNAGCFTAAGGVLKPYVPAGGVPGTAADALLNPNCDSGTALRKFVDQLPLPALPGGLAIPKSTDKSFVSNPLAANYIPVGVPSPWVNPVGVATTDDYYEIAVVEYKQKMHADLANPTVLRGYVQIDPYTTDSKAGLSNGATQIKINGTPITTSIALTQIDGVTPILIPRPDNSVPASTLVLDSQHIRGADGVIYKLVQAWAVDKPQYLGPVLTASKGKPTRIKFINLLPSGRALNNARNGDIPLPVDETLPGAGYGPDGKIKFSQNRAMIHLHGGDNPWISDGTPHQWITPAAEALPSAGGTLKTIADQAALNNVDPTHYLKGWSAVNVPDMPDPGPGAMTYYYPNGESARMEWYHDHTFGLTRLNVYEGMASAYFLSDAADGLATYEGVSIPAEQIPLVIQDKTFVPKDIAVEDARWDAVYWGGESSLWYPHVYETNQLPTVPAAPAGFPTKLAASIDGTYPPGRWDWGPWFWPVFPSFYDRLPSGEHIASYNTVAGVAANSGLSEVTVTPEAFMDTALVNGKAYPTLTVEPKAYRFKILNAANDRYFNLGFYLAADKVTTSATSPKDPAAQPVLCDGVQKRTDNSTPALTDCTEVKMVGFDTSYPNAYYPTLPTTPFTPDGQFSFPTTGGPLGTGWGPQTGFFALDNSVPDPATAGPSMTMIGNETGYLASAVNIPSTIVNYEISKQAITILNVKERGVFVNPAGRVDVVVDFSKYAGKTLILYNDTGAPVPAGDPRLDYRTGMGDNSTVGGAENVLPGYGPSTRTLMQVYVSPTVTTPGGITNGVDQTAINTAVQALFKKNQPNPIVPAGNYGTINTGTTGTGAAYVGFGFTTTDPITYTQVKSGCTSAATCTETLVTLPSGGTVVNAKTENKAIQELFEPTFGRMNATLGVELPYMTALTATTVPLGYVDPATETVPEGQVQFWRITHNGVDAHPVHFHLVNVQVINRVDWAGLVKPPYPDENGWKETVVMAPLEDIFVAVRAKAPSLPFGLPLSVRPRDPSQALGAGGTGANGVGAPTVVSGFTQINPADGSPMTVTNQMDNYQWEYVWHCHILGHEENDFMRPFVFDYWNGKNTKTGAVYDNLPAAPGALAASLVSNKIKLTWTDPTPVSNPATFAPDPKNEIGYHLTVSSPGTTGTATTVNKSAVVTLTAANPAILVGMAVSGTGIPAGATVSAVSGTGLTLSSAATATTATGASVSLSFNLIKKYELLANTTSWINPDPLAAGTTYSFNLVGYNALGSGTSATATYAATSTAVAPTITSLPVTASSITVNFNSVAGTTYFVQYSTDKANWITMPALTAAAASSSLSISNLAANTSYYVRVGASNNAGATAAYSAISTVITNALPAVSMSASSTALSTTVTTATMTVTWVLPQGGGTPVLTYQPAGGAAVVLNTLAANATSATVTGLPANTAYSLSLVLKGSNGASSTAITASLTTNVLPATIAAATLITSSSASIAWTQPAGATSQSVTISPTTVTGIAGTASVVVTGNSAALSNLAPNTLYTVTINETGASGVATVATKTFTTVPGSVANVSMSVTGANGTLSWTNPVGGGTVTVTSTSTAITIGTLAANASSVAITKLVAGTAYSFTITVKNGTVAGTAVTYSALAVPAPTGVSANIGSANTVVMKYTTVTGVTGYTVQMASAAAGPWTNMTGTTTTALTVATTVATAPTNFTNTTYYFRVVPSLGASLGTPSAAIAVNMSTAPAIVTGVGFTAGAAGSKTVTIAWTKGSNVTSVAVTRSQRIVTTTGGTTTTSWGAYTTVATVTGGATSYVDSTLTSAQVYQYKLVATNPAGSSTTAALPAAGFTAP